MPYTGFTAPHTAPATGVLIANLGTPEAPTKQAVRPYLAQFLSDRRIVELPRLLWQPVLHGILLNTRPAKSARAYASIWREDGSPLLVFTKQLADGLHGHLRGRIDGPLHVEVGMTYGQPSIQSALENLRAANVRRVVVLPLFAQYSATTVGSVWDAVSSTLQTWRWVPDLTFITQHYDQPGYIDLLAGAVRAHWAEHGQPDRLLISFHGVPQSYITGGDPYFCQCQLTASRLAYALGLPGDRWQVVFQSRLGPVEWLRPYLDETFEALPGEGVKHVQVIAPSFSTDCLETLEEIAIEGQETFHEAGGETFSYIPALNNRPDHLSFLAEVITGKLSGARALTGGEQEYCYTPHTDKCPRCQAAAAAHA